MNYLNNFCKTYLPIYVFKRSFASVEIRTCLFYTIGYNSNLLLILLPRLSHSDLWEYFHTLLALVVGACDFLPGTIRRSMLILPILESDISLAVLVPFTGGWHFGTKVWALTVLVPLAAVACCTYKQGVCVYTNACVLRCL